MIKGTMQLGGDIVEYIIRGNELMFFDLSSGVLTTIEGVQLKKSGCVKEFPDLEGDPDWRKKSIERLKEKMKSYNNEMEKLEYVKDELSKHGYNAMFYQRAGFRPQKFKELVL